MREYYQKEDQKLNDYLLIDAFLVLCELHGGWKIWCYVRTKDNRTNKLWTRTCEFISCTIWFDGKHWEIGFRTSKMSAVFNSRYNSFCRIYVNWEMEVFAKNKIEHLLGIHLNCGKSVSFHYIYKVFHASTIISATLITVKINHSLKLWV